MPVRLTRANVLVREDAGRVAVERGPLVYCLESADQPAIRSLFDVELTGPAEPFREEFDAGQLGGVLVLRHKGGVAEKPFEDEPLYQPVARTLPPLFKPIDLSFIPYYAWAKRGLT
jgi:DUF1680 family protein